VALEKMARISSSKRISKKMAKTAVQKNQVILIKTTTIWPTQPIKAIWTKCKYLSRMNVDLERLEIKVMEVVTIQTR
jgi:hypothetical protein